MVDPAMEGLYRAKFLSWLTGAIACVQMRKKREPEFMPRMLELMQ